MHAEALTFDSLINSSIRTAFCLPRSAHSRMCRSMTFSSPSTRASNHLAFENTECPPAATKEGKLTLGIVKKSSMGQTGQSLSPPVCKRAHICSPLARVTRDIDPLESPVAVGKLPELARH